MPLPMAEKNLVAKKLDAFLGKKAPPHVADKIRLTLHVPWQLGNDMGTSGTLEKGLAGMVSTCSRATALPAENPCLDALLA